MNIKLIGYWAFIVGIAIAIIAGFIKDIPAVAVILFILGLIVGLFNIKEKESTSFLVAVIALLVIGVSFLQLGELTPRVVPVLNYFIAFVAASGLVVAIKQVVFLAKK